MMLRSPRWLRTGAAAPAILATAACLCTRQAVANDGGIAQGGNPGLLKGHSSVSMVRERIRITVGDRILCADCRFVFVNHGPACTVRMGFPDQGVGALDPDNDKDPVDVMRTPARTTFKSFRSYVSGRRVGVTVIRADTEGSYWHVKTVRFPAHAVLRIRDVYTQEVGGGEALIGGVAGFASQVGYIVHTGASWHGPIGRSEIRVSFVGHNPRAPLVAIPGSRVIRGTDGRAVNTRFLPRGAVVWRGPCPPTVQRRTLRFVRTAWTPTPRDDLQLTYNYQLDRSEEPTAAALASEVRAGGEENQRTTRQIELRYHALAAAIEARNVHAAKQVLSGDFLWRPPDGETLRRSAYLRMVFSRPSHTRIQFVIRHVAYAHGQALVDVTQTIAEPTPRDDDQSRLFMNTYSHELRDTWVRRQGRWRLCVTDVQR